MKFNLKGTFPIIDWLPSYNKQIFRYDLIAGLTVGVMLIPQAMAYSMLAGLQPIHGLYAASLPLILYAIFGSSRHLAVGPVAIVSILTAAGIGALEPGDYQQYLLYTITLAFMVGVLQFGMGLLKMGFIANFLSHPVISGFTSAAAIIIGLSQIRHLFGISMPSSDKFYEIVLAFLQNVGEMNPLTLIVGVVGIIVIKFSKKIHSAMPGALLAVVLGILSVAFFNLSDRGVAILGEVPGGLPALMLPSFEGEVWMKLLPIALTIALIGFAESYAVAKTVQSRHKDYKLNGNQELVGLGVANFGSTFLQGIPVTGGFSRTAVNDQTGAKTGMAAIISAVLVIMTLLFLTPLFFYLPNAILAAVIIVAVLGLVNIKEPMRLWKKDRADFYLLLSTFLVTLTGGIEVGIVVGFALSIILVVYRASNPHMARLGKVPGTNLYRNIERFKEVEEREEVLIFRVDGPLYFANMDYIKNKLDHWIEDKGEKLKIIVLNAHTLTYVDSSAAHVLKDWILEWNRAGLETYLTGARGPVRDALERWGITKELGVDHTYSSNEHLFLFLDGKISETDKEKWDIYALQCND
ncbi:MAG: solute carrier 26 family protein [Saprospirales bacterium]|nr:MAG: solute carrier 26 family protein [Saprospirales bacterium]